MDEKRFDSDNRFEDYQAYENLVKETIDYESLEVTHHDDMRQVDEIVNLIVETVMCKNDKILIASNWYPASLVKKKFLMLTYPHIEYVLHCMTRISQQECRGILGSIINRFNISTIRDHHKCVRLHASYNSKLFSFNRKS